MSDLPKDDPFDLAGKIIQAFPADDNWDVREVATLARFREALCEFRDGKMSWEALQSLVADSPNRSIGYISPEKGKTYNIFHRSQRPAPEEVAMVLKNIEFAFRERAKDPRQFADPEYPSFHLKESLFPASSPSQLPDKRLWTLANVLAEAAIYNALVKTPGANKPGPLSIEMLDDGRIAYRSYGGGFGDVRRQAAEELKSVKTYLAGQFFTQGEGANKEYRILRDIPHPYLSGLPSCLLRALDGNGREDIVNEYEGKPIPTAYQAQLAPEEFERVIGAENSGNVIRYYVARGPERCAWLERVFDIGPARGQSGA